MNDFVAAQPSAGRAITRQPYRGRRLRSRSTGQVFVWNGDHYVPESASTTAPESQPLLERERGALAQASSNASLGQQFLEHNARQETGGWVEAIPGLNTLGRPDSQAMQGLTSQMLRANIREGTSGTLNSVPEMNLALAQYPSLNTSGPINRTRVLRLQIERDLQQARLSEAEHWARERGNLDGFEQHWSAQGPQLRARLERQYSQTNGPIDAQFDPATGRQRPNPTPPQRGGGLAASGANAGAARVRTYNPRTGRLE